MVGGGSGNEVRMWLISIACLWWVTSYVNNTEDSLRLCNILNLNFPRDFPGFNIEQPATSAHQAMNNPSLGKTMLLWSGFCSKFFPSAVC